MKKILASALVGAMATLVASPASALIVDTVVDGGNVVDTTFTGPGLAAVDVQFNIFNIATSSVTFAVEDAEAGGSVAFNGFLENFVGAGLEILNISLSGGATFDLVGDILPAFSIPTVESQSATAVKISFSPGEGTDITLGDPFIFGGVDWEIGLANLRPGDTFTLSFTAVPEPTSIALMGLGLAALGGTSRRRRKMWS